MHAHMHTCARSVHAQMRNAHTRGEWARFGIDATAGGISYRFSFMPFLPVFIFFNTCHQGNAPGSFWHHLIHRPGSGAAGEWRGAYSLIWSQATRRPAVLCTRASRLQRVIDYVRMCMCVCVCVCVCVFVYILSALARSSHWSPEP